MILDVGFASRALIAKRSYRDIGGEGPKVGIEIEVYEKASFSSSGCTLQSSRLDTQIC